MPNLVSLRVVAVVAIDIRYSGTSALPFSPSSSRVSGDHFEKAPQKAVTRHYGRIQQGGHTISSYTMRIR